MVDTSLPKSQTPWPGMASSEEEEKEEEDSLNVALFATRCVEEVGLFFHRYLTQRAKTKKKQKKRRRRKKKKNEKQGKQPRKAADATRVSAAVCNARAGTKGKKMEAAGEYNKHSFCRRKRGLWNADTELCLWTDLVNLIGQYERHLSVLVPLHPSVLHEDSIRFALLGQPSERIEDFPLLFNVHVAMACGTYSQIKSTSGFDGANALIG